MGICLCWLAALLPAPSSNAAARMYLTILESLSFFCLGCSIALLGPTLLALARQTGGSLAQLSFVFAARSMGYLLGSVFSGALCDTLSSRAEREAEAYWALHGGGSLEAAKEQQEHQAHEAAAAPAHVSAPAWPPQDDDKDTRAAAQGQGATQRSSSYTDEGGDGEAHPGETLADNAENEEEDDNGDDDATAPLVPLSSGAHALAPQGLMMTAAAKRRKGPLAVLACVCAPLLARANVSGLAAMALSGTAISALLVPFMRTVTGLASVVVLQGLAMGLLDTAGNLMLLSMWGPQRSGPYLQALHCLFGVGTFLAPFLARSLVSGNDALEGHTAVCGGSDTPYANITTTFTTAAPLLTPLSTTGLPDPEVVVVSVKGAYWVVAAIIVPVVLGFIWMSSHEGMALRAPGGRYSVPKSAQSEADAAAAELAHGYSKPLSRDRRRLALTIGFIFFGLYVGLEVSFGGYIFTYVVTTCALRFDASSAALITSVYWGLFAVGRISAIFLAARFKPRTLVLADLALCCSAALLIAARPDDRNTLWFASGLFGLGMASIFPSGFHYLEQRLRLTGRSASLMVIGSALGEMLVPLSVGMAFDHGGPHTFPPTNATLVLVAAGLFFLLTAALGDPIRFTTPSGPRRVATTEAGIDLQKVNAALDTHQRRHGDSADSATKELGVAEATF